MDSIILALQGIALTVIPALGYLVWQVVKLHQIKLANQIKRAEQEALAHSLSAAASTAVKSTSQTIVAGKRGTEGGLSPEVADAAKESARQTLKKLLTPEQLAEVRAQYGSEEGAVNRVLDPLIEAALHDQKKGEGTPAPLPKKETGT